jgi:hypothetical protein
MMRPTNILAMAACTLLCGAAMAAGPTAATPGSPKPWDGAKLADCDGLIKMTAQELATKAKSGDIDQCLQRGYDPCVDCRPIEGAKIGAGFNRNSVGDPAVPPQKAGARPSVSGIKINFSLKFPPWSSAETKPDPETGVTGEACPEATDQTGVFGDSVTLTGSGSYNLACGGSMPLSSYPTTLVSNPTGLASTEYSSYFLWSYQNQGGKYVLNGGAAVALPTYLCTFNSKSKKMEKSVDLPAPIAQMITYNASMGALALRMIDPQGNSNTDLIDETGSAEPEKYLVIPLVNGVPQVPPDCANEADYYKAIAPTGELIIQPNMTEGCEGADELCGAAGQSEAPAVPDNCETVTTYPSGVTQTPSGAVQCTGKIQVLVVDRPNLVHQPGTTATTAAIDGRTAVMAASTQGSQLYVSSNTIVLLPHSGKSFTFASGGTVALGNGSLLTMKGPATINTGTGQIILTGGGDLRDGSGNTVANYTPGVAINPGMTYPLRVKPDGTVEIPPGFAAPTQPSPYVRGPAGE